METFFASPSWAWIKDVVLALFLFVVIAFTSERGLQGIKIFLRGVAAKVPFLKFVAPKGIGSFLLSLVVAVFVVFGFDIKPLQEFQIFQTLDPNLVSIVTALVSWLLSNVIHDSMPKSPAAK